MINKLIPHWMQWVVICDKNCWVLIRQIKVVIWFSVGTMLCGADSVILPVAHDLYSPYLHTHPGLSIFTQLPSFNWKISGRVLKNCFGDF